MKETARTCPAACSGVRCLTERMQEDIREREKIMHGLKKDDTPLWKEAGFITTSSGHIWGSVG